MLCTANSTGSECTTTWAWRKSSAKRRRNPVMVCQTRSRKHLRRWHHQGTLVIWPALPELRQEIEEPDTKEGEQIEPLDDTVGPLSATQSGSHQIDGGEWNWLSTCELRLFTSIKEEEEWEKLETTESSYLGIHLDLRSRASQSYQVNRIRSFRCECACEYVCVRASSRPTPIRCACVRKLATH